MQKSISFSDFPQTNEDNKITLVISTVSLLRCLQQKMMFQTFVSLKNVEKPEVVKTTEKDEKYEREW